MSLHETTLSIAPVVRSLGTMMFDPCWAERVHTSSSCELLYVMRGSVTLQLGETQFPAGPGDLLLVPPETDHRDEFDPVQGLQVFLVFFEWAGAGEFFTQVSNHSLVALPAARKREIARLIERLRNDVQGDSFADQLVARSRLLAILMLMLREAQTAGDGSRHESRGATGKRRRQGLMLTAKAYLDAHYHEPISLEDIADSLHVSAFYLSHVFSQESNFSLFSYLTNLRMERARKLLCDGQLNVSEVARCVGYENSNYFSKVFRKHFGQPPSDFLGIPSSLETNNAIFDPK